MPSRTPMVMRVWRWYLCKF